MGLGFALLFDYEYSHIDNKSSGPLACFLAALIYFIYPAWLIGIWARSKFKTKKRVIAEEIPLIDLSRDSINE